MTDTLDAAAAELNKLDPGYTSVRPSDLAPAGVPNGTPAPSPMGDTSPAGDTDTEPEPSTWDRIDLEEVMLGDYVQPMPSLLTRDDARSLWYAGQVNGLHGDSGTGKGWVANFAIKQAITDGLKVMMIDLEDVPSSIVARLRLLGLTDAQITTGLDYRRPQSGFTYEAVQRLTEEITAGGHALVVIDSLGEAFALDGIDENKDAEVGPWLRQVARPLADTGAAVVLVDHSTKASDNPLHPSGSKRKRAAIGGASYLVEAPKPLKKGQGGRLKITCAKDRHGNYARGEHVGDLVLADGGDENLSFTLYAPEARPRGDQGAAEVVFIAAKFVRMVKETDVPLSKKSAVAMVAAKVRTDTKRAALDYAISAGAIREELGQRGAKNLVFVQDLDTPK